MSKSLGNAILLSADADEIRTAVRAMYTDPQHIKISDPGRVEGNVVFIYLDAFHPDGVLVEELKMRYRHGGLGDMAVKQVLEEVLQEILAPIRSRRAELASLPDLTLELLQTGTAKARQVTAATLKEVKEAMGLLDLGIGGGVKIIE